ncbi:hypothetical protein LCGC14_2320330 [marine sediment metagenome]|uniref:Uncharacterized protein n=1 Tax=marine sediment metagenome TaxID=412755 RepID=A0A0F9FCU1_9ZZZZ
MFGAPLLGALVQSQYGVLMMVKVVRGEGRFAHWVRPKKFEVVASKKRERLGQRAMGQSLIDYPRVRTSRPYYRFVRLGISE